MLSPSRHNCRLSKSVQWQNGVLIRAQPMACCLAYSLATFRTVLRLSLLLVFCIGGLNLRGQSAIPPNDNFATRIPLFGTNLTTTGSNVGGTLEPGEPNPSGAGEKSVWWTWTAPTDGGVALSTAGSDFITLLTVLTGDALTNLTLAGINGTATNESHLTFNVTAGTAYQIDVDGVGGRAGNISLQLSLGPVQPPPPNDNFSNRITLTGTNLSNATGSNVGATKEPGEPLHADAQGGKSVWWTWTAPYSGRLTLTTTGSPFDTVLGVYTGNSVSNLTFVAANDEDPLSTTGMISRVTCNVKANTTYQFAVDGFDDSSGEIHLQLNLGSAFPVPPNDNFSNRTGIVGSSLTVTGYNTGASFEAVGADFADGEPEHLATLGGKSVWWSWTAPNSGNVTLTTANSTLDTLLAVYTGNDFTNLVFVAGNDEDPLSPTGGVSRATFNATNGTTYQIVVDGYDGCSGNIFLNLSMSSLVRAPTNDSFANRVLLTGTNVIASGSSLGATFEPDEPLPNGAYGGKSVWWQWVSPGPGMVTVDTIGSGFDTLLAVYTGSTLSNLTAVASDDQSGGNNTSLVTFYTKSGVTYQIAVDGYDGDSGNISLHIAFTPASYSLTVATDPLGAGAVTINPLPDQNGKYAPDSVVTLSATPAPGCVFTSWTGDLLATNNPVALGMNSNRSVTAGFFLPPPTLMAYSPQSAQSIQTNGFRLLLSGPTNRPYAFERTTNFVTWTAFLTNQFTSTQFTEIRDYAATNSPLGLYRARRIP